MPHHKKIVISLVPLRSKLSQKTIILLGLLIISINLLPGCGKQDSKLDEPIYQYTITFNKNDDAASGTMPIQSFTYGLSENLASNTFVKTGWIFAGWATSPEGAVVYLNNAVYTTGSSNITLYAKWALPSTYNVIYNGNGSTGGIIPSDLKNYLELELVTVIGNTGSLEKIQDGISFLFTGWNTLPNGTGTNYSGGATFRISNANVTLYAQWSALRRTGPAGGIIFYDKGSYSGSPSWRYLEAAPAASQWSEKAWGAMFTKIGGASQTSIGSGKSNTSVIVTWLNAHSETDRAAQLCFNLNLNGYNDWFLPSKDELNLMYTNLKMFGVGGFDITGYYRTSSEYDSAYAWHQFFMDGTQDFQGIKDSTVGMRVRAIRQF